MKKKVLFFFLTLVLMSGSFVYGIAVMELEIFPYHLIRHSYLKITNLKGWAIGVYTGDSPFNLSDSDKIKNPVLTAQDVTDREAQFVADPFVLAENSKYYMFFEVLNKKSDQGDIGLAESSDGLNWKYRQIVLDEDFHLSYPYVFKWNDNYYLIPETERDLSVRIYKAEKYPTKWKYIGDLLKGYRFIDPSVVYYNDMWWMFVSALGDDVLNLYFADDLMGPWNQHPQSPIIKNDGNIARPAGRVLVLEDRLYRFTQDDYPVYGSHVLAFEITEITTTSYKERKVSDKPIVMAGEASWNTHGMHHVDPFRIGDKQWAAAVDGR